METKEKKQISPDTGKQPKCLKCGKGMKMAYDMIAKAYTGYLWKCECTPGVILSIG